jgi:phosphoenolpyruvate-protein phosphotransferase (PTS system enzyme I)
LRNRKIRNIEMTIKKNTNKEWVLSGIPISNGLALGKATIVHRFGRESGAEENTTIDPQNIKEEIARLKQVLQILLVVLQSSEEFLLKHSNADAAAIYALQRAFLMDPVLKSRMYQEIEKKQWTAEKALRLVLNEYAHQFEASENLRIRERVSDIHDLENMLLDALSDPLLLLPENFKKKSNTHARIAVAVELTPRLVIEQSMIGVKGIIAENGGRTSHAAILCQALGIPAITGINDATNTIGKGRTVLINGTEGTLIISPTRKTVFRIFYNKVVNQIPKQFHLQDGYSCPISILATINFARESRNASKSQADGIGLYRTEMECIALRRFLSEEEQVYRYLEVQENMEGRPVYMRLMDFGGDKKIFGSAGVRQVNSNSRGSQFLLENPDVLDTQARALARASKNGCLNVIYPMISSAAQFSAIKTRFLAGASLQESCVIRHGAMIESTEACYQARELLLEADFASIGTNDLTEQLFKFNRNSDEAYQAAKQPALWEMIELVVAAGRNAGKPVFVCGELPKRPEFLKKFIDFGVSGISIPIMMIPDFRNQIAMKT